MSAHSVVNYGKCSAAQYEYSEKWFGLSQCNNGNDMWWIGFYCAIFDFGIKQQKAKNWRGFFSDETQQN